MECTDWQLRTVSFRKGEQVLPRYRIGGARELVADNGRRVWLLNPPELRIWSDDSLLSRHEVGWGLRQVDDGVAIWTDDRRAEADLVELSHVAAEELSGPAREGLAVTPMCVPLHGPVDLSNYLVGARVIAPGSSDPYPRFPVDQTALSVYRIARWHGGAFWDGVANHIASATVERVMRAPTSGPITDLWGHREVHVRFLADTVLLLAAHAEARPGTHVNLALDRACRALEAYAMPWQGGQWIAHDSIEKQAGRNDLVLNTHIHAIVAMKAAGGDVTGPRQSLNIVLQSCVSGSAGRALGGALAVADLSRAHLPRRVSTRIASRIHQSSAKYASEQRRLRFPGGFIARDASGQPAPWYYFAVNLNDLAVAMRNFPTPEIANALERALQFAKRSHYLHAQLRWRDSLTPTIAPAILRNASDDSAASAAAARALQSGLAPTIGWPGYVDALWSRLAPGTP